MSEYYNSTNFESDSSSEIEDELRFLKADTSKRVYLSHTAFDAFRSGLKLIKVNCDKSFIQVQNALILTRENKDHVLIKSRYGNIKRNFERRCWRKKIFEVKLQG